MLNLFSHDGTLRVESNPLKVGNQRPPLYNSAELDTPAPILHVFLSPNTLAIHH